ncbi:acyl-CoA synthetase short-chain family member 3, mitochondrial isoform X2 [Paroedura picta]|uniref:acyl-CoA synthetase short-chain family member 3, mitochondrial isoform X2 n=1 Tax=Paroedura picta TaxID=143630 RepID=UPI00405778C4
MDAVHSQSASHSRKGEGLRARSKARTGATLDLVFATQKCPGARGRAYSPRNPVRLFLVPLVNLEDAIFLGTRSRAGVPRSCPLVPAGQGQPGTRSENMSAQCGRVLLLQKVVCGGRSACWGSGVSLRPVGRQSKVRFVARWAGGPSPASFSTRAAAPAGGYEAVYRASVEEPGKLWAEAAQGIEWHKPWTKTMERRDPCSTSWFVGGELNICYNAVDRHVLNGQGDQIAIIHDSPVTNTKEVITYKEVLEQVSKLAGVMVKHGVKKGDTVVIYMPMIPQTMYTMLACARIGAIHSLIFGGFASKELSTRIDHAKPKLIVTSTFGVEPGRKVEYVPLLEKALQMIEHQPDRVLIYSRPKMGTVPLTQGRDIDWQEEMANTKSCDCVPVLSDHPLYILYTSGTTGTPKGVVRPTGGYAVMLNWTMSAVYGLRPKEVWWAASDLGWVVGHSYICYGPLLHGNTTVLYEGKPVGTPDAGAYFRVLAEHGVAALFTAPTAIRAIRQQDSEATLGKQYNLTKFRTLFVAGERCDVDTLEWCKKIFKVPVLDHWWQTETGSAITATCVGLGNSLTPPPGQTGRLVPGYNVVILDDKKQPVKANTLGNIVVKYPERALTELLCENSSGRRTKQCPQASKPEQNNSTQNWQPPTASTTATKLGEWTTLTTATVPHQNKTLKERTVKINF